MMNPKPTARWGRMLAAAALTFFSTSSFAEPGDGTVAPWPADTCPIKAGETLPSTMVKAADGTAVDLAESVTAKPTLLVFYRGGW